MGILNRIFGSEESLAKEMELDDEKVTKAWSEYLSTVHPKSVAGVLLKASPKDALPQLKKLLTLELSDVSEAEKKESDIIADLEKIEHSERIQRIHSLKSRLDYAQSQDEYAHGLLHELHKSLSAQILLVENMLSSKELDRSAQLFFSQLEVEREIIRKIGTLKSFSDFFLILAKGEHIICRMDATKKRLFEKMQRGLRGVFTAEKDNGIACEWARTLLGSLDDKINEAVADGSLNGHRFSDFEFVNSDAFIPFAREIAFKVRPKGVSDQMITIFVKLFREWFHTDLRL